MLTPSTGTPRHGAELFLPPPRGSQLQPVDDHTGPDFASLEFKVVKRGLDATEVTQALRTADEMIASLRSRLAEVNQQLAETNGRAYDRVRESTAAGFLGDEAARMLAATRAAAADLEQRAAERSQQLIDDANLRSAAVMLELEHETGRRLGEIESLESNARQAALDATEQKRADADMYAEAIRAAADAYANHTRQAADADARSQLAHVDDRIEEITRTARRDADQITQEAEATADQLLTAVELREREATTRLTRERLAFTQESAAFDRRRAELIELLDRVQAVSAAGLLELTGAVPFVPEPSRTESPWALGADADDVFVAADLDLDADKPASTSSDDDPGDDLLWRQGA